jgi:hypothetical protein
MPAGAPRRTRPRRGSDWPPSSRSPMCLQPKSRRALLTARSATNSNNARLAKQPRRPSSASASANAAHAHTVRVALDCVLHRHAAVEDHVHQGLDLQHVGKRRQRRILAQRVARKRSALRDKAPDWRKSQNRRLVKRMPRNAKRWDRQGDVNQPGEVTTKRIKANT